jgi:hypothetical protein
LIDGCDWYRVYDIIEAISNSFKPADRDTFERGVNDYFMENGIGWKIEKGMIETRGDEIFESAITKVTDLLETAKLLTAQAEIKEAIRDLSRRPKADITGGIQHAGAALECVAREIAGDRNATLGEIIKKYPDLVPKPLDKAIDMVWGFVSEKGRHIKEGKGPELHEAELVVELTSGIASYLVKKKYGIDQQNKNEEKDDQLSF